MRFVFSAVLIGCSSLAACAGLARVDPNELPVCEEAPRDDGATTPRVLDSPPQLESPDDLTELLRSEYPRELRSAGVSGAPVVSFLIRTDGTVGEAVQVERTSGHPELDEAAVRVVQQFEFVPAWINQGSSRCRIPVMTSLAVPFDSRM